jgi:hypothetical protein
MSLGQWDRGKRNGWLKGNVRIAELKIRSAWMLTELRYVAAADAFIKFARSLGG